jgi:hypothetical protein
MGLALNLLARRFAPLSRFAALLKGLYFNRIVAIRRGEAAIQGSEYITLDELLGEEEIALVLAGPARR